MANTRKHFFDQDANNLRAVVARSYSYREVLASFGAEYTSAAYSRLKRALADNKISTAHFAPSTSRANAANTKSLQELCSSSLTRNAVLKAALIRENVKQYKCESCGLAEWRDQPIVLELDHIDGNTLNNAVENLQLLCPNCHSQTPTWRGRGKKGKSYAAQHGTVLSRYMMLKELSLTERPCSPTVEAADLNPAE